MKNTILHKAETRGTANFGWLQSKHTFSFGSYHNPDRIHFGALRVLNDDKVAPGMGFGTHAHDNMEIISITLEGDLEHKDSMGNTTIIKKGDVQIMSAGSGITHSEYNKNKDKDVQFLQIWVYPNQQNVTPRYDQISMQASQLKNTMLQILSPSANDDGVWIHQNAWFHWANFDAGHSQTYALKDNSHGVYVFVLHGDLLLENQPLSSRDGMGVWDGTDIKFETLTNVEFLLMEVPMKW